MSDEPLTFRIKSVTVEIGDHKKAFILRDLPYERQQELLKKIGQILFSKETIPTAIKGVERSIQYQMVKDGKTAEDAIKIFIEKISDLYAELNGENINELLKIATNDQLDDDDIKQMGSQERIGFLLYLIDRQFKSLKNLHASLTDMLSPTTTNPGK